MLVEGEKINKEGWNTDISMFFQMHFDVFSNTVKNNKILKILDFQNSDSFASNIFLSGKIIHNKNKKKEKK